MGARCRYNLVAEEVHHKLSWYEDADETVHRSAEYCQFDGI